MRKSMMLAGIYLSIFSIMVPQIAMEFISGYFKRVLSNFSIQADQPFIFIEENVAETVLTSDSALCCAEKCLLLQTCLAYCFDSDNASCALCHDTFQQSAPEGSAPLNADLRNYTSCYYKVNFYAVSAQQGQALCSVKYPTLPPSYRQPSWMSTNRGPPAKFNSSLAVDGNLTPQFTQASCIHTSEAVIDVTPWWYVDLQATYAVFSTLIVNRNDKGITSRLHDIEIRVGFFKFDNNSNALFQKNQLCFGIYEHINLTMVFRSCTPDPVFGRYVSLQIVGNCGKKPGCDPKEANRNILVVCEVEVYGVKMGRSYIGDF